MFFNANLKISPLKHAVYLFSTTVLGILLSLLVHAGIEMLYLNWAEGQGIATAFHLGCALPLWIQIVILSLGALGGFLLGRIWWRKVYIDRIWAK